MNYLSGDEDNRVNSPQHRVQSPTSGRTSCSSDSISEKGPVQALVASPKKETKRMLSYQEIADGHKFSKVSFLETLHSKITEGIHSLLRICAQLECKRLALLKTGCGKIHLKGTDLALTFENLCPA